MFSCFEYFLYVFVCEHLWVCGCGCVVCVHMCVCTCMWRPEIHVTCLPQSLLDLTVLKQGFPLILELARSPMCLRLSNTPRDPPGSLAQELQAYSHHAQPFTGLNSGPQTCVASTLLPESSQIPRDDFWLAIYFPLHSLKSPQTMLSPVLACAQRTLEIFPFKW